MDSKLKRMVLKRLRAEAEEEVEVVEVVEVDCVKELSQRLAREVMLRKPLRE